MNGSLRCYPGLAQVERHTARDHGASGSSQALKPEESPTATSIAATNPLSTKSHTAMVKHELFFGLDSLLFTLMLDFEFQGKA